ncbi:MAG: DUF484 family protein [Xanthomonadales bacterium]|jgi:hypothetical protein|nr:DUF484 family protein [Xanthomonadales bacterium]
MPTNDLASLDEQAVAAYLRRTPDFLRRHPDLALILKLPRELGNATSLASYQLDILRERNHALERRLDGLLANARENEVLMHRVHLLALRMLRSRTFAEGVQQLAASLREDFHADVDVRVLLVAMPSVPALGEWLVQRSETDERLAPLKRALHLGEPVCGRFRDEVLGAFGYAEGVQSAVLLPLPAIGYVGVASEDPNRFHAGMGTAFLKLIGELASTALAMLAERPRDA